MVHLLLRSTPGNDSKEQSFFAPNPLASAFWLRTIYDVQCKISLKLAKIWLSYG